MVLQSKETVVAWVVNLAQDPATRTFLVEKLNQGMERASKRTWGDVFEQLPPERMSKWLIGAARSEVAATIYTEGAKRLATLERLKKE